MTQADELQISIYAQMSPVEKWQEVLRLRQLAWSLKKAFIKSQDPELTNDQIEAEVRRIFLYANT